MGPPRARATGGPAGRSPPVNIGGGCVHSRSASGQRSVGVLGRRTAGDGRIAIESQAPSDARRLPTAPGPFASGRRSPSTPSGRSWIRPSRGRRTTTSKWSTKMESHCQPRWRRRPARRWGRRVSILGTRRHVSSPHAGGEYRRTQSRLHRVVHRSLQTRPISGLNDIRNPERNVPRAGPHGQGTELQPGLVSGARRRRE